MSNNPEATSKFMSAGLRHVANARTGGGSGGAGTSEVGLPSRIYICLIDGGKTRRLYDSSLFLMCTCPPLGILGIG